MAYVEVHSVSKTINNIRLISDVSLSVEKGKTLGLVGHNGSGKTVLMKMISGLFAPSEGHIFVNGKELGKDADFPESMGIIIENPGFIAAYSGYRNLKLLAGIKKKARRDDIRDAMKTVGLDPDCRKHVSKYSLGMRQRLAIAQAIMKKPELLILDEPFNGLDSSGVAEMREVLRKCKRKGQTIIMSSHCEDDINALCDEVYLMEGGRLSQIFTGTI